MILSQWLIRSVEEPFVTPDQLICDYPPMCTIDREGFMKAGSPM